MAKRNVTAKETYNAILQTDYCEYVDYVHQGMWKKTKFHRYLCQYVQNFVERPTNKPYEILIVTTPPQVGKSTTLTETLPSWYVGRHPERHIIEISYNIDFARRFGRMNRQKIRDFGSDIFGIEISEEAAKADDFELKGYLKSGMMSAGIGTAVTGNRADLMIIDDPIKNHQEASSKSRRELIWNEWYSTYRSRLQPGAKVIVIMTRWHEDDLAGRMLATEENVKVLRFPMECEEAGDPLGRNIGDPLVPELGKDRNWLDEFKKSTITKEGTMSWNALYQCRPSALEGNLINRDWWMYYDELPKINTWCMSVDAAFKDGDDNDYTAIQVWGKTGADIYLVDAVEKHLNFPDTISEIRRLRGMYEDCKVTLIEDKANGTAIITMLQRELTGIIPVQPNGNKISRVQAVIGTIESGNVYLPAKKKYTADFIEECSSFPNGTHDDGVDAMSQALFRLIFQRGDKFLERPLSAMEKMFPAYYKNRNNHGGHGKYTPF